VARCAVLKFPGLKAVSVAKLCRCTEVQLPLLEAGGSHLKDKSGLKLEQNLSAAI